VAIAAMISPKETFVSYKDLMDWIARKSGMEVELVQRTKYEEVNDLLKKDLLDVAFVCTGAYVEGHDDFGMEILVAPVTQGRTVYYSYVIVPADSPVRSFGELRGKSFAFTDPMSNTGKLAPTYKLAQMKMTPADFFRSTAYTYSHDKSIESVARKLVDGASVDSLVWDYMNRKDPTLTSRTRIIDKSPPYGIPPVVVARAVPPALRKDLRELFLHAHEDPEGKRILASVMIDRFEVVEDRIYDSVRSMKKWVGRNAGK
jgi:phosphonate transport system substrate-binding protein